VYLRPTRALIAIPTHDNLTCIVVAWPIDQPVDEQGLQQRMHPGIAEAQPGDA
jgi:hypothetical protein